jgi:outer membrane protein
MKLFRVLFCVPVFAMTAAAQTNVPALTQTNVPADATTNMPVRQMSLQDCIQMALEHNLDIKIERYAPQISLYTLKIGYGGYDPLYSISGEHAFSMSGGGFNQSIGIPIPSSTVNADIFNSGLTGVLPSGLTYNFSGNIAQSKGSGGGLTNSSESTSGRVGVQLTQPLLKNFWIDSTRLSIAIAKNRLHYSEQGLRYQILTSIQSVENAYYDLIADRDNVEVQEMAVRLAEQLLAEDTKRVEVGSLAPLSQTQDESQAASARAALLAARQALAAQENTLKALIADNYRSLHDVDIQPSEQLASPVQFFDLQDSWRKGLTQRPDYIQAKLNLEQNGITLKYDKNQLFPELDLIGSYGHNAGAIRQFNQGFNDFREGNQPFYNYGAQMTFPLSNLKARSQYKSDKLTVEQSLLTLKKLEQTIMVSIDNDIKKAQADYLQVEATREATIYAEAALDAEQKKLDNGKSTSFVVLQLQSNLTTARGQEIQALDNYNKDLAQLAFDEASTFERRGITVQIR